MTKVDQVYSRKGAVIIDLSSPDDSVTRSKVYDSVNLAKKASVKLQLTNGGLGCGYVQVSK